MTQTEALKLALEALRDNQHLVADNERHAYVMEYNGIIEKCEEALAQQSNEQVEPRFKLMPREATREMLEAMDKCSMEGYDERLYEGHASSVYMAAWDAFYGQLCYCGDITNLGVIHRDDGPCHYPDHKEPEQEPVAFPDAPQTIYLQVGDECPEDAKWKELVDVCWCDEQVFDNDIVYVRADTTPPQRKPLTDEAAMFAAQHMFLEWNRRHDERLVKVAYEYGVFQKAIELYNEAYRIAKGNA